MADDGIVIKKIKKGGGHGHHGGAWKVAYADFVTAMMAFFLLMWLLNATEAENLAGLADYFAPTVGISGEMGIGFRGGKGALSSGIGADKNTNKGIVFGGTPAGPIVKVTERVEVETMETDSEKLAVIIGDHAKSEGESGGGELSEAEDALSRYVGEIAEEEGLEGAVNLRKTPDGLEIQITDTKGEAMFETGTAVLRPAVTDALEKLAEVLSKMNNYISITGHTSAIPVQRGGNYGNWELSADRANATRRVLVRSGVPVEQIAQVVGKSDNDPLDIKNPDSPVNSRISIVLLRRSIAPDHKRGAPERVFIDTESENSRELKDTPEVIEEEQIIDESMSNAIDDILHNEEEVEQDGSINTQDPFSNNGPASSAPLDSLPE